MLEDGDNNFSKNMMDIKNMKNRKNKKKMYNID